MEEVGIDEDVEGGSEDVDDDGSCWRGGGLDGFVDGTFATLGAADAAFPAAADFFCC